MSAIMSLRRGRGHGMERGRWSLGGIHYAWVVVAVTFVAMLAGSGVRSSFGVYVKPLEAEFGWDRATISGVAALSLLVYGLAQPLIGRLVDQFGTRLVMTGSLLLLGLGAFATALVHELWQLYLTYGVVVSLAAGGPAPVSIAAIAARWFAARRGLVVGIGTAGISAGQLSLVPVAMWLTVMLDWRASYIALAALLCLVTAPLVWLLLRDDPADVGQAPFGAKQPSAVGSTGAARPAPAPERSARLADAF